jgi:hypothetical protein
MNDLNPLICYIALESDISPSKVTELFGRAFCGLSIELAVVDFKSLRLVPRLNATDISIYWFAETIGKPLSFMGSQNLQLAVFNANIIFGSKKRPILLAKEGAKNGMSLQGCVMA